MCSLILESIHSIYTGGLKQGVIFRYKLKYIDISWTTFK